ncbi:MAG: serine/threonine protein kinase [Planctomycetes bacterium]|nr:serine/threonine protein kinase [Planctomycetota bacterium]
MTRSPDDLRLLWAVAATGALPREAALRLAREALGAPLRERLHREHGVALTALVTAAQHADRTLVRCGTCGTKTPLRQVRLDDASARCSCGGTVGLPSLLRELAREGAPPPVPPPTAGGPGRIGAYEIRGRVGAGAMGTVYRAYDPNLQREVALKVLHPQLASDANFVRRFRREAIVLARLRHPNIVPVYDLGEHEGIPYLAMAYLPGQTVRARVRTEGPRDARTALAWTSQALWGLCAAHAEGVVHRDVKPDNLLLDPAGEGEEVRLVDFGLAKPPEMRADISGGALVLGTPAYMSPEQCRGEAATPASDLYSLGCTMYFMLSGTPPFQGDAPVEVMHAHLDRAPARLAPLPDTCWNFLARLMAKSPSERPAGAAEAQRSATSLLAEMAIAAPRPGGPGHASDGETTVREPPTF